MNSEFKVQLLFYGLGLMRFLLDLSIALKSCSKPQTLHYLFKFYYKILFIFVFDFIIHLNLNSNKFLLY